MTINFDVLDRSLKPRLLSATTTELAYLFTENEKQRYRIFLLIGVKKFSEAFIFLDDDLQVDFFVSLKKIEQQQLINCLSVNDMKIS